MARSLKREVTERLKYCSNKLSLEIMIKHDLKKTACPLASQTFPHPTSELDRYIGNTHHRCRLWDNRYHRNNRQLMTIGDQSVPMFHNDITLLDQQSLSQASIDCGNKTLEIRPPSHRLYRQGISCHRYAIFNRKNDKKKTKFDDPVPN